MVLGSALYMGKWIKAARALAVQLAEEPAGRALWMFTVGPLRNPPRPEDGKPEEEIARIATDRAVEHRLFMLGRLDRSQLNRREKLAVRAVNAAEGDFRDWAEIDAWADQIAASLGVGEMREETADSGRLLTRRISSRDARRAPVGAKSEKP